MKKIITSLFILAIVLSGCSQSSSPTGSYHQSVAPGEVSDSRFQYLEPFSLNQVKTALILAGLQLSDSQQANPGDYQINNVAPTIYSINYSNHILLVYIFQTTGDRKEGSWSGQLIGFPAIQAPPRGDYLTRSYAASNVIIADILTANRPQEITSMDEQVTKTVQKAVRSLNGSQEVAFADKGTYWDACYIVDYYQHWYKDAADTTHVDQYSNGRWVVKYIGPDPQSIQNISYEYKTPGHGGSGDGMFEKSGEDYYLRLGSGDSSNIPAKDSVCTLTVQWDGHEESLNLKLP